MQPPPKHGRLFHLYANGALAPVWVVVLECPKGMKSFWKQKASDARDL